VINYDRDAWWKTVFSFNGTVLPQVLGRVGLLTVLTLGLCLLNDFVLEHYHSPLPELDPLGHTVLGTALGLLVVFRTNSSFSRYWEARTMWGGIVNAARNLARSATAFSGPADDLARLSCAYCLTLKQALRGSTDFSAVRNLVPAHVYDRLTHAVDAPGILARCMSEWIAERLASGKINPIIANRFEEDVDALVNAQGGCERIRRTPLPFVYAALIKQTLLIYLLTLPFVLVPKMGYAAPLVMAVLSLGLLGIEEAGVEIENPFGTAPNSLPLEAICEVIAKSTAEATTP
jgi:putative membrane protein